MQLSNGLSNPLGLWIGHFLWDSIFSVSIATVVVVIFATASDQFHGIGYMVRTSTWPSAVAYTENPDQVVGARVVWERKHSLCVLRFDVFFFASLCFRSCRRVSSRRLHRGSFFPPRIDMSAHPLLALHNSISYHIDVRKGFPC